MRLETDQIISIYVLCFGWVTVCIQLFIIPFFKKIESLHKDYITDGAIAATKSSIETSRLIPSIAKLLIRTYDAQTDKRKKSSEDEIQQILQEVEYLPDLEEAQNSMNDISKLNFLYDSLSRHAGYVWKLGLLHVFVVICIPNTYWIKERYDEILMVIAIVFAFTGLIATLACFFFYNKRMEQFLKLLRQNHYGD